LSRSITVENSTRPAIAIAVNSTTAMAARSRPITGSRNEIWWTMKPTCANSTSANAKDTVRNATSRNASLRICVADGASALIAAIAALEPIDRLAKYDASITVEVSIRRSGQVFGPDGS
jgi:hypothetical protein